MISDLKSIATQYREGLITAGEAHQRLIVKLLELDTSLDSMTDTTIGWLTEAIDATPSPQPADVRAD